MMILKPQHFRSQKLLDAAEGQACALCGSIGTTVAAHANYVEYGKGTGIKVPDSLTAWLCQGCHFQIDSGNVMTGEEKWEQWHRAFARTIVKLFDQQIVVVK